MDALKKKFGPQAPQLMQRVITSAKPDGVAFADWKWRANTVNGEADWGLGRGSG
jgi:hypothetical protein